MEFKQAVEVIANLHEAAQAVAAAQIEREKILKDGDVKLAALAKKIDEATRDQADSVKNAADWKQKADRAKVEFEQISDALTKLKARHSSEKSALENTRRLASDLKNRVADLR